MPKIEKEVPDKVRPFLTHGLFLEGTDRQMYGECPFCERAKFYVNAQDGQWDCKVCMLKGNAFTFIRTLYERSLNVTDYTSDTIKKLAQNRKLSVKTLRAWGIALNMVTGDIIVPGYNHEHSVNNLYRYTHIPSEGRWAWFGTPGMNHGMFGLDLFDRKKDDVCCAEGIWDGMALWEVMNQTAIKDGQYRFTGNPRIALGSEYNVIAVPSASVFNEKWPQILAGKNVSLFYDNDWPQEKEGGTVPPVGTEGMKRATGVLMKHPTPPYSVQYLHWGDEGYTKNFPHRYDVRDHLTKDVVSNTQRCERLGNLMEMLRPVPESWRYGGDPRTLHSCPDDTPQLPLLECSTFAELDEAFKEALEWTPGLRGMLIFDLAIVLSTEFQGDQLWGMAMSPPSTAKTTIAEAVSTARQYVFPRSELTGFSSGYKVDAEGAQNFSLIDKLNNMTLIVKDADPILRSPNRDKILSQLRDIYDRTYRTEFGNGMGRSREGQNTTIIFNGTSTLMEMDAAEKGARFLMYSAMNEIDETLERNVNWRVARRALKNLACRSNGKPETRETPEMTKAKQLTGGYIMYLRENAETLLARYNDTPDSFLQKVIEMGQFVAFMRARQPKNQDEVVEREFSPRLVSQHIRLMGCTAAVLNKEKVDDEVMALVRKVAVDTAQGKTLDLVHHLFPLGREGAILETIGRWTHQTDRKAEAMLQFLVRIRVVEQFKKKCENVYRWRLTQRLAALYDAVMSEE